MNKILGSKCYRAQLNKILARRPRNLRSRYSSQASNHRLPSNPFPFPKHANPTPYQLFHLPDSASQKDIKSRYFDLVRIYHPDSPVARTLPPETAQSHFQAITRAYDTLRGKSRPGDTEGGMSAETLRSRAQDLSTALWKAQMARRAEFADVESDEKWEGRFVLGLVVVTLAGFAAQLLWTRHRKMKELAAMRAQAREARRARLQQESTDCSVEEISPLHSVTR